MKGKTVVTGSVDNTLKVWSCRWNYIILLN
jgi:WD40 repeat protein